MPARNQTCQPGASPSICFCRRFLSCSFQTLSSCSLDCMVSLARTSRLLLSRRLWQAQENGHKNAFCTHMNLDLPIPSSHCCHGSLGRCKDVAHYHSGAALPEFNDFGLILPFFPLFLACSSSEPGLGWVIIACAGLSPGIHVCRCHILNLLMRSSQGMAVPWVVWLCQGAGGDPQLSTTSPGTPVLHRPGRLFSWKFIF